jgi:hypothetical protein
MTGSLEKPWLRESRPGEEGADGLRPRNLAAAGEGETPTEKKERVEEEVLSRTALTAAKVHRQRPQVDAAEMEAVETVAAAEATQERQAVAVPRQGQEALVVASLGATTADHSEDTLPLERPAQGSAGPQAAFHSAPTLPVLPQEPPYTARQSQRWPQGRQGQPWPGPRQRAAQGRAGGPSFKKLWIGTLIASLLLLLVSVSLLVYLLGVLAAREGLSPASLLPATASGKLTGAQRGQGSTAIELALFPQSFSPANCLPDNGYRCTATLMASGPAGSVRWQAWSQGVAARFSPANGSIEPGQQQQVIIYLPATCPASGKLIFSWTNRQLSVPWHC